MRKRASPIHKLIARSTRDAHTKCFNNPLNICKMKKPLSLNSTLLNVKDIPLLVIAHVLVELFFKLGSFTLELLSLIVLFIVFKTIASFVGSLLGKR